MRKSEQGSLDEQVAAQVAEALSGVLSEDFECEFTKFGQGPVDGAMEFRWPGGTAKFFTENKESADLKMLPQLVRSAESAEGPWMLLAIVTTSSLRDALKQQGFCYADSSGNAFIKAPGLYIFRENTGAPARTILTARSGLTPMGVRILYLLLVAPETLNWTYRELAAASGLSLGAVNAFMSWMTKQKFLTVNAKGKRIIRRRAELAGRWVDGYADMLHARILRGRFRFDPRKSFEWSSIPIQAQEECWGGEAGGYMLHQELIPARFQLFSGRPTTSLIQDLGLIPDENGAVEVCMPFWHNIHNTHLPAAEPLLVYAELVRQVDPRVLGLAESIRQKYLLEILN